MTDRYRDGHAMPPQTLSHFDGPFIEVRGKLTIVCQRCGDTGVLDMGRARMSLACDCEAGKRAVERWKKEDEERVERVARAISKAQHSIVPQEWTDERFEWARNHWMNTARLAIQAMGT